MIQISPLLSLAPGVSITPAAPARPQLLAEASLGSFAVALDAIVLPGAADAAPPGEVPAEALLAQPLAGRQTPAADGNGLPVEGLEIEGKPEGSDPSDPQPSAGTPEEDPALAWLPGQPIILPEAVPPAKPETVIEQKPSAGTDKKPVVDPAVPPSVVTPNARPARAQTKTKTGLAAPMPRRFRKQTVAQPRAAKPDKAATGGATPAAAAKTKVAVPEVAVVPTLAPDLPAALPLTPDTPVVTSSGASIAPIATPAPSTPVIASPQAATPAFGATEVPIDEVAAALNPVVLTPAETPATPELVRALRTPAGDATPQPNLRPTIDAILPPELQAALPPASAPALFQLALEPAPRRFRPSEGALVTPLSPGPADLTTPLHQVAATASAQEQLLDMRRQEWAGQMVEMIDAMRDASPTKETRIRLMPEALGQVDVSIRQDGERVHVHFATETQAARQMLQDAQPRLSDLAEARGLRLGQTSVDSGGASSNGQRQEAAQQSAAQPSRSASESAGDSTSSPQSTDERIA